MRSQNPYPRSPNSTPVQDPIDADPAIASCLDHFITYLEWHLCNRGLPRDGLPHVLDAVEEHICVATKKYGLTTDDKIFRPTLVRVRELVPLDSSPPSDTIWHASLAELHGFMVKLKIDLAFVDHRVNGGECQSVSNSDADNRLKNLNLSDAEIEIILAIGEQSLIGKQIAHKIDRPADSSAVRGTLSVLRNTRKILGGSRSGYFIRDEFRWLLNELQKQEGDDGLS